MAETRRSARCAPIGRAEETEVADEFLDACPRNSRRTAGRGNGKAGQPESIDLLNSWGGVTIAYRRRMIDSPSYTLNHEEVAKALEEGIRFAESLTPRSCGSR